MTNHNKKRKRSDLHNNTSLNIFCNNNTEEEIDEIENEFNKVLLEKAQQNTIEDEDENDNYIKKYVLNNLQLDKIELEFEKKYNIRYNPQF